MARVKLAFDKTPDREMASPRGTALLNDLKALANSINELYDTIDQGFLKVEEEDGFPSVPGVSVIKVGNLQVRKGKTGEAIISFDTDLIPVSPFWRLRGYMWDVTSSAIPDTTYINGGNLPGGRTARNWREWCLGPDGGYRQGGDWAGWVQWARLGVKNESGSLQTVSWWVPGVDDSIGSCYHRKTNNSGTIAIAGTAVTGTGTFFTVEFVADDFIVVGAGTNLQILRIASITDNTNIVLANAANAVAAGATYQRGIKIHNFSKSAGDTNATEANGTFDMADGEEGVINLFHLNIENADNQNSHLFAFITDALEKVTWTDAGAIT